MPSSMQRVLLVVPCYNESGRITPFLEDLAASFRDEEGVRVLVVDDGSEGAEQSRLTAAAGKITAGRTLFAPPLLLPENLGKGGAVYTGWKANQGEEWLAFVDADGSCSAAEVRRLIDTARARGTQTAFFASRIKMLGRRVERRLHRHLLGRVYATLVSEMLDIPVYDSQCGLKVVPRTAWEPLVPVLEEPGFAFDAQLLAALLDSGVRVEEVPIDWHDEPGGKIRLIQDAWKMFWAILAIARARRTARWRAATAGSNA